MTLLPDHRLPPTVLLKAADSASAARRSRTPTVRIAGFEAPSCRAVVDERLAQLLAPVDGDPARLRQAMRHAALSPGKRFRPVLTLLAARRCGLDDWRALDAACAIEMVHAASLILDDLPCMDDAALRRGQPTTHRLFGEDIAILAAVGLLNEAFAVMAGAEAIDGHTKAALCRLLASTVGPAGLLGGQEFDLRDRQRATDPAAIERFNHAKTGVLMQAAVECGAIIAGAGEEERSAFRTFGRHLGDAFQTLDDLLDATSNEAQIRKDVGKDSGRTATVITLFGAKGARDAVQAHLDRACAALEVRPVTPDPLAHFVRASFTEFAQA